MLYQIQDFDLLRARDSTKNDFSKLAVVERPIGDTVNNLERLLYDCHAQVLSVVDETGNILPRHLGKLLLGYFLQTRQYDILLAIVAVDHSKLDDTFSFLEHYRLFVILDVFVLFGACGVDGCVDSSTNAILFRGSGGSGARSSFLGGTTVGIGDRKE